MKKDRKSPFKYYTITNKEGGRPFTMKIISEDERLITTGDKSVVIKLIQGFSARKQNTVLTELIKTGESIYRLQQMLEDEVMFYEGEVNDSI